MKWSIYREGRECAEKNNGFMIMNPYAYGTIEAAYWEMGLFEELILQCVRKIDELEKDTK